MGVLGLLWSGQDRHCVLHNAPTFGLCPDLSMKTAGEFPFGGSL